MTKLIIKKHRNGEKHVEVMYVQYSAMECIQPHTNSLRFPAVYTWYHLSTRMSGPSAKVYTSCPKCSNLWTPRPAHNLFRSNRRHPLCLELVISGTYNDFTVISLLSGQSHIVSCHFSH